MKMTIYFPSEWDCYKCWDWFIERKIVVDVLWAKIDNYSWIAEYNF